MKKHFTIIVLLLFSNVIIAQNVIWSEDFGGGQIPPNWLNVDVSNQITNPWTWTTSGSYFGPQLYFASPTANNGFIIFDSYILGIQNGNMPFPQNHDGRLTTSSINCSSLTNVIARFSNQYSYFTTGGNSQPSLGVSTDGVNFTYFPILTNLPPGITNDSEQIEEVDISSIAAGQNNVYLQFRWVGNYEYTWRIDDIKIQDSFTPLLPNNTAITNYSVPYAFQIPASQIDTFFLEGNINNLGSNNQNNVVFKATITDDNNQIVYTDSDTTAILNISNANKLIQLNDYDNPNLAKGAYKLTYNLTQDSTDNNGNDNLAEFDFVISDSTFALDNGNFAGGFAAGSGPIAEGKYGVANYYYVPNDGDIATSVTFAINNPYDIPNETIEFVLYKVDIDNDGNLDDDGNGFFNSADIASNVKGYAAYTFSGNESPDKLITVSLESFSSPDDSIPLDGASSYIIVMEYSGSNLMLFTVNNPIPYSSLGSIGIDTNTDTWYLGGFPNGLLAVIRLNIQDVLSDSKSIKLAENIFEIFPNPAKEYLHLAFNATKTIRELQLSITDISGKTVLTKTMQNISNQSIELNIEQLTTGNYFINIQTEQGQLTKKVIVINE